MLTKKKPGVVYLERVTDILARIRTTQYEKIQQAALLCAKSISNSGLVHLFATGHSRVVVEEMFPRYGSFPGFHLMVELSLTNHTQVVGSNGQRQARFLENIEGFGEIILDNFVLHNPDVMLVISNSGLHCVDIDIALGAKKRNIPVIAITSVEHSMSLPTSHSSGQKLMDIADIVLDTFNPPGDALVEIDGLEDLIGPGSTIAATAVANALKCEIAAELTQLGQPPKVFVNPYFGAERSQKKIAECYDEYQRRIARMR